MSDDIVFVCTADNCDEGPWEGLTTRWPTAPNTRTTVTPGVRSMRSTKSFPRRQRESAIIEISSTRGASKGALAQDD